MKWSFADIWNNSLDIGRPERKLEERDYIWASELGGSMIDRYLKMKAVKPSNPHNKRSKRKFEAGNMWEFVVRLVLLRAGILKSAQHRVEYQYEGLLRVSGKMDFLAGGKPDYDKAKNELDILEELGLPEFFITTTEKIIDHFKQEYPDGLPEIPIEVKSCSTFMFDKYFESGCANPNHILQLFHYEKGDRYNEGHIVYVCRDDARLLEIPVFNPSPIEDVYKKDIETLTKYIKEGVQPPLEKLVVFDKEFQKFSANWKVGYSQYLTMLYGFKNTLQFQNAFKSKIGRWNRVIGRIKKGDNMTKNNIEAIEEMKKDGFDINNLLNEKK